MSMLVLTVVVLAEVALFQIIAALANRTLVVQEVQSLGSAVPGSVLRHAGRTPRLRVGLGIVLAGVSLVPASGLIADPVAGKLLLTAVALLSAAAFMIALAQDRVVMRTLAEMTPDTRVRRASLRRRSIRDWYPPALEAIPVAVFIATSVFVLSTPGLLGIASDEIVGRFAAARSGIIVLYVLQGVFVFGALFRTLYKGVRIETMAAHIPSLRKRPEEAMRLSEQLAGVQLRYFMFVKIAIAMLLGSAIVGDVLEATGQPAAWIWSAARWGLVGLLLVTFALYLRRVAGISRRMQRGADVPGHDVARAG